VLNEHYTVLADQMAQEILEHKEDFESGGFGGDAENIVEKYARRIQRQGWSIPLCAGRRIKKSRKGAACSGARISNGCYCRSFGASTC
jgi:hypothetical protein